MFTKQRQTWKHIYKTKHKKLVIRKGNYLLNQLNWVFVADWADIVSIIPNLNYTSLATTTRCQLQLQFIYLKLIAVIGVRWHAKFIFGY